MAGKRTRLSHGFRPHTNEKASKLTLSKIPLTLACDHPPTARLTFGSNQNMCGTVRLSPLTEEQENSNNVILSHRC